MCLPAMADIYVRDDSGVPVFSDMPDGGGFNLFLRTNDLPRTSLARHGDASRASDRMRLYTPLVESIARQNDLEPALLHAVIMVESGYNPDAKSPKGAVGLMQLMPQTAQRFGTTNRNDPEQNLKGGARYLSLLINQFGGNLSLALAAYNAGENAVRRWGMKIPPFNETNRYVPAVLNRYRWLMNRQMS
ncbi:lytic transglycosylase domain-containing protein [Dechloromonas sp. HYN0024]|nr:lytic transglycosylase domain-containing protein [Dechloromonas sp. HYN0024]